MSVNQETEMTRNGHATDVCTNSMKHISLEQMEPEPRPFIGKDQRMTINGWISDGVLHLDLAKLVNSYNIPQAKESHQQIKVPEVSASDDSSSNADNVTASTMKNEQHVAQKALEAGSKPYHIERLTTAVEKEHFCPIEYVYDCLPRSFNWLQPQQLTMPNSILEQTDRKGLSIFEHTRRNSIALSHRDSALPIFTGLTSIRQCKHWQANNRASAKLLELFAQDQRCKDVVLPDGRSMAIWAQEALANKVSDCVNRFAVYMWPDSDEERLCLLGQTLILIFIFDDLWEYASSSINDHIRTDFVARLEGRTSPAITDTALQVGIDAIRTGLLHDDANAGNGGAQVIAALVEFCNHAHPKAFAGVREYLDYRFEDVGAEYLWACSKVAVRSSADQHAPKFHRFLNAAADHISIGNDIASYDKELRAYQSGEAAEMINVVQVIKESHRLEDVGEAKGMACAWQLHSEDWMGRELKKLQEIEGEEALSADEWRFVDAVLHVASGSVFTGVVISRYGGERVEPEQ